MRLYRLKGFSMFDYYLIEHYLNISREDSHSYPKKLIHAHLNTVHEHLKKEGHNLKELHKKWNRENRKVAEGSI